MKIELITLCEYAVNHNGTLSIINTIDSFTFDKLPWRAYFGFAIKGIIKHPRPEETNLKIQIIRNDNQQVMFEVLTPIKEKAGRFAAAANLRGLIFEKAGEYILKITTDNGLCEEYGFNVNVVNLQTNDKFKIS